MLHETVRQALALGQMGRKVQIVHCDWFEESTVHNRKLPEHEYSMKKREAERRAAEREKKRIDRGIANGEKFVNTSRHSKKGAVLCFSVANVQVG